MACLLTLSPTSLLHDLKKNGSKIGHGKWAKDDTDIFVVNIQKWKHKMSLHGGNLSHIILYLI
jgi:hypothetical protein